MFIRTHLVSSILWLEDTYLIAYAMIYDIAVFVYNGTSNRWLVYNETDSRGYMSLYFTGSHFDVMRGGAMRCDAVLVPASAEWHPVQFDKMYAFPGVWSRSAHKSVNVVTVHLP